MAKGPPPRCTTITSSNSTIGGPDPRKLHRPCSYRAHTHKVRVVVSQRRSQEFSSGGGSKFRCMQSRMEDSIFTNASPAIALLK